MLTAVKLLFITLWMVVPGFVGMACDCLHAPMSTNAGHDMPAAHMTAMTQDYASQALTGDDCAHKCAAKAATDQVHIFAPKPSEIKWPIVNFAQKTLNWQESALAYSVSAVPVRHYFYSAAGPPDKTPVMMKTRLLI